VHERLTGHPTAWVVVHTHPNKEQFALENLARQDFVPYCPMMSKRASGSAKAKAACRHVARPLFPGYLVVETPVDRQSWRPILSTYGVRNLIRFGNHIASLDQRFVQALRAREVDGLVARPETPHAIGDRITICGGPFDGIIATILSMSERDRLVVLLDILSRPVKVRIDAAHAMPLAS
jgi:transcriptional antiterminator RfaH